MLRTRKWEFVKQEATRLADLGLSSSEIGRRLGISKASINRWRASGKLSRNRAVRQSAHVPVRAAQTAAEWAASVREDYDLDATDAQLVALAEEALLVSRDADTSWRVRLAAVARFQSLVKQLSLRVRGAEAEQPAPAAEPQPAPQPAPQKPARDMRRSGGDPRILLMPNAHPPGA
jgi:hypothetical protein